MKKRRMGLRTKIILAMLLIITLCIGPMVTLIYVQTVDTMTVSAYQTAYLVAEQAARDIGRTLDDKYAALNALDLYTLSMLRSNKADRVAYDAYVHDVTQANPDIFGIWVLFEPDAFDGLDAQYTDMPEKYDWTGQFQVWWLHNDDGSVEYITSSMEGLDDFEYYALPKTQRKAVVLPPYVDEDTGLLMTSMCMPVILDGPVLGVIGVDIVLTEMQSAIVGIKPYETGYAALISQDGLYVAYPKNPALAGQSYAGPADALNAVKGARSFEYETDGELNVIVPITIGDTTVSWGVEVTIPLDKALAGVADLQRLILSFVAVSVVVLIAGIALLTNSFIKPITTLAAEARLLSEGDTSRDIRLRRNDEVGDLSASFDALREAIRGIITETHSISDAVAQGDLQVRLDPGRLSGDYTAIFEGLNSTMDTIDGLVASLKRAAHDVARNAKAIEQGSQFLAQGSSQQAAAVQQITASITDIAGSTELTARNAQRARALAHDVHIAAQGCNDYMAQLERAVDDIQSSGKDVSKVIKTIQDIAFQTNILAINASVEAAHAGPFGASFAVVAGEVGMLAGKSRQAAESTTAIIATSLSKSSDGARLAKQTAEKLASILEGIGQAAVLVADIAEASERQSSAIGQIKNGISQVAEVVQHNNATAQQNAAAGSDISDGAARLDAMVQHYVITQYDNALPPARTTEAQ